MTLVESSAVPASTQNAERTLYDQFTLHVLDLRHSELATEEDKAWGIDHWAKLFKVTIWEELRMIAQNSEYMAEGLPK